MLNSIIFKEITIIVAEIKSLSMQKEFHFRQAEDSIFLKLKIMLAFQPRKDKLRRLFREASSSDDDPVWDTYHVL